MTTFEFIQSTRKKIYEKGNISQAVKATLAYALIMCGINIGFFMLSMMGLGLVLMLYIIATTGITIGYARVMLNIFRGVKTNAFDVVSGYEEGYADSALTLLLRQVFIMLWSILLIVPGIIAKYSYAMTEYILADKTVSSKYDAIKVSKEIMNGNKARLFFIELMYGVIGLAIIVAVALTTFLLGVVGGNIIIVLLLFLIVIPTQFVVGMFIFMELSFIKAAMYEMLKEDIKQVQSTQKEQEEMKKLVEETIVVEEDDKKEEETREIVMEMEEDEVEPEV